MEETLVIVAAGKSSRFGGYPKAFCNLGRCTNIQNTIALAGQFFPKIYVVVNKETHDSGIDSGIDAEVIPIVTGQGDADSLLKALKKISARSPATEQVTVCWGDAVFVSDTPFKEMIAHARNWSAQSPAMVGCSMDAAPYAWFDTDGRSITGAHFQKDGNGCLQGLHDQSIFRFRLKQIIRFLESYKRSLGLDKYDPDSYDAARGEMKLLNSFAFFYEQEKLSAAEYCLLTKDQVKAFNTPEELDQIIAELK